VDYSRAFSLVPSLTCLVGQDYCLISSSLKGFQPGAIPNMFGRPGLLPNKLISPFSGSSGSSGNNPMTSFMPSPLGTSFSSSFGGATAFGSTFGASSSSSSSSFKSGSCFSNFKGSLAAGKSEVDYHKKSTMHQRLRHHSRQSLVSHRVYHLLLLLLHALLQLLTMYVKHIEHYTVLIVSCLLTPYVSMVVCC
jgi:hypothetical protein